jgi:hypothetical protein
MRTFLIILMFILSFLFAVLLAISMKLFLFNIIKPVLYSEGSSNIFLNLPLNISSYIPLILIGFFLNFVNYSEMQHYVWNVIWSVIFGITIFNFFKLGFIISSTHFKFSSKIILYLWENILPYFIVGVFITIFSILIKKQKINKQISCLPAFLTIIWLILVGKLKLDNNLNYFSAIISTIIPSFIITNLKKSFNKN